MNTTNHDNLHPYPAGFRCPLVADCEEWQDGELREEAREAIEAALGRWRELECKAEVLERVREYCKAEYSCATWFWDVHKDQRAGEARLAYWKVLQFIEEAETE